MKNDEPKIVYIFKERTDSLKIEESLGEIGWSSVGVSCRPSLFDHFLSFERRVFL